MFTKKSKPYASPAVAFERALDAALSAASSANVSRYEIVRILEQAIANERRIIAANISLSPGFVSGNIAPSIGDRTRSLADTLLGRHSD